MIELLRPKQSQLIVYFNLLLQSVSIEILFGSSTIIKCKKTFLISLNAEKCTISERVNFNGILAVTKLTLCRSVWENFTSLFSQTLTRVSVLKLISKTIRQRDSWTVMENESVGKGHCGKFVIFYRYLIKEYQIVCRAE